MKLKLNIVIVLSLVFMLSACGPAGNTPQAELPNIKPQSAVNETQSKLTQPPDSVATETLKAPKEVPTPTEEVPPPVPTSRGPDLEATDPSLVALASGNLQLVEFFRFT
jgi:type IV secretory pathway VirB10-like protein